MKLLKIRIKHTLLANFNSLAAKVFIRSPEIKKFEIVEEKKTYRYFGT